MTRRFRKTRKTRKQKRRGGGCGNGLKCLFCYKNGAILRFSDDEGNIYDCECCNRKYNVNEYGKVICLKGCQ